MLASSGSVQPKVHLYVVNRPGVKIFIDAVLPIPQTCASRLRHHDEEKGADQPPRNTSTDYVEFFDNPYGTKANTYLGELSIQRSLGGALADFCPAHSQVVLINKCDGLVSTFFYILTTSRAGHERAV